MLDNGLLFERWFLDHPLSPDSDLRADAWNSYRFLLPGLFLDGAFAVVGAAFAEDKRMIEAQQRIWETTLPDRQMAFIPQDKAPAMFRRLVKSRLAAEMRSVSETMPRR